MRLEKFSDGEQLGRIEALKRRAQQLTGGELHEQTSNDCPLEIQEQFWKDVVAWESAPETSYFDLLLEAGLQLPDPDELLEQHLPDKLWEVINHLHKLQVYLSHTDHLSDRELYTLLWQELLREPTKDLAHGADWSCHLDVLGGYSREERFLYHRFYADEHEREYWSSTCPDEELPQKETPPFDRDRRLPKSPDPHQRL